jgi:hypothetical protein
MGTRRWLAHSGLLAFCLSSAAHAGYYTQTELVVPNPVTRKPMKAQVELWREGMRMKQTAPMGDGIIILDLQKREAVGMEPSKKQYWKMPFDRYQKIAQTQLVGLGIVPDANGKYVVPARMFEKTGQTATVEGRPAYETKAKASIQLPPQMVAPGGPTAIETSISVWLSEGLPLTTEDRAAELRLQLGDPKSAEFAALSGQLSVFKGYPVQTTSTVKTPQGDIQSSTTLLQYRELTVPAAEFEVPKGYTLVDDPMIQLERAMQTPAGIGAPLQK